MDNQAIDNLKYWGHHSDHMYANDVLELIAELESVQYERDQYQKWRDDLQQKLESVQRERDDARFNVEQMWKNIASAEEQISSLQRDKAALIEVLELYTDDSQYCGNCDTVSYNDNGGPALAILTQMKG